MTREQLIQRTTGAKRLQMRGQALKGFDFSEMDLTGVDFRFCDLRRANFEGATLRKADLSFASLRGANFAGADLQDADLSFSDLSNSNLNGANITGTIMNFAVVTAAPDPGRTEPLTLAKLLQKPGWGVLIGMFMSALAVYGMSGIIYFSSQIATIKDPVLAQFYRFLVTQNMLLGATVFLVVWSLSSWLDHMFKALWKRHLLASIATFIAIIIISFVAFMWLGKSAIDVLMQRPGFGRDYVPSWAYMASYMLVANLFLYILRQGRQLTRKLSEQEYQLLNMEKLKTRAELDALQAKINPHFLYNALNSIASLVHEDPDKAETMTLLLSKLFRYSTGRDGSMFTTLAEELEMVKTYLQVEQVRFGDRLSFEIEGGNEVVNAMTIPQFLLQPLVENAIKHGISKRAGNGCIRISIREEADWLCLSVHDNGPAFAESMSGGYGLRSIQDKLRLLYGDDARVELQNEPLKQVCIWLKKSKLIVVSDKR
ncbi:histidine kinase [Fibrella aquatilis]|uniref:Histidine kinase n=1 Tax=Fibrella aquatilis TaxID=2817059 RepID=A0A939GAK5_9BACT|nr:histidine kinase [Fibrella aquatilis]MBO0933107.1 histidine kinase [Fibrella aquatilis]